MGLSLMDWRQLVALALLGGLAVVLLGAHGFVLGRTMLFLLWNMFLAVLPVGAALLARHLARRRFASPGRGWFLFLGAATLWLGFFPNAPYIATDLMHLRNSKPTYLWLDVLVIGSAAATGIYAGLLSLRWMHEALLARGARPWLGWVLVLAATLAAGFGVYLGRFQRWNTWDILTRPGDVLQGAWSSLDEVRVLAFALMFALGLIVGYLVLTLLVGWPEAGPKPATERPAER